MPRQGSANAGFLPVALVLGLLAGCAGLPPGADFPRHPSSALADPQTTRLGQHFATDAARNRGQSGFRLISVGAEGFALRIQMIDAAERTIDLQYYIFHGDTTGRLLTGALLRAADRGVRVRILVDDGETDPGDEQLTALESHPEVELRIFNPFSYRGHWTAIRALEFSLNAARLDYRMHNKLMLIDNSVALIGGRNIGDQYFQMDPDSQFADDDLFVTGPVVARLSTTFDEFWRCPLSIPAQALAGGMTTHADLRAQREALKGEALLPAPGGNDAARSSSGEPLSGILAGRRPLSWANVTLIYDSPEKKLVDNGEEIGRLMHGQVVDEARSVDAELLMVTPYLVPGEVGMRLLAGLRQRGARVRILTNSLESSTELLAQSAYMVYRRPMLEVGVELYEIRSRPGNPHGSGETSALTKYGNYSLHAKMLVFDRRRVFIGSMNFDQRSEHLNTEIGLLIDSPELAGQIAARFDAMVQPANAYAVILGRPGQFGDRVLLWRYLDGARTVTVDTEPARSWWQRLRANALARLPLDDEL